MIAFKRVEEELSAIGLCELFSEDGLEPNKNNKRLHECSSSSGESEKRFALTASLEESLSIEYESEMCAFRERVYMSQGRRVFVGGDDDDERDTNTN